MTILRSFCPLGAVFFPIAVLVGALLLFSAPSETEPLGELCQEVVGEKDSCSAPVAFSTKLASPYTYKFDTGYLPSLPFRVKTFYYSSAGELDLKAAGDLIASWEAAQAFPGNKLQISIRAEGNSEESRWESDGGLRFGARYKFDVDFGWKRFKKADYIPKIPNFDISWPCVTTFSTFALSSPYEACAIFWERGDVPCFLPLEEDRPPEWPSSCGEDLGPDPQVDFDWCCKPDTGKLDTLGFWAYIRANPSVKFGLGANLGACAVLSLDGDSIYDSQSGGAIETDGGTIQIDLDIPCEFAKATEGQRVFHFTQGPFSYHANLLFQLVGKLEPVIKPCIAELLEISISVGAAICGLIVPNEFLEISFPLPFSEMDATFSVPISDPLVCNIKPAPPNTVIALDTIPITWNTSWGAPDSCDCKVDLWYHLRPNSLSPWEPWILVDTTRLNTGTYSSWVVPPFINHEAQILVEFLDSEKNFLHKDSSSIFSIIPPCSVWPESLDFGSVALGGYVDSSVIITNINLSLLSGSVVVGSCPDFSIIGTDSYSLLFGQSDTFTIRFQPQLAGSRECLVDMGDSLCNDLFCIGEGVMVNPCGDCNKDNTVALADAIFLLNYLFRGGPPPNPLCIGNVDCIGIISLSDVIYMLNYLFKEGKAPCNDCCSALSGANEF